MERSQEHLAEFVPLANAAALLYVQVMGEPLRVGNVAKMNEILERGAAALAGVTAIYSRDPASGTYAEVGQMDLLFGVFQRGATLLASPRAQHRHLCIRRADMRSAIAILRRAGFRFRP